MFQTFNVTSSPDQAAPRVTNLRIAMADAGLDGFLIPRADAHQGEYVAPCDERLAWLTGFTGSAGSAAVLTDRAAMFTDGRYTVQVRAQCDTDLFECIDWPATSVAKWLGRTDAQKIGFDPWLHTVAEVRDLREALTQLGKDLVSTNNLVDKIWADRPARPNAPVTAHPIELAGKTSQDKFEQINEALHTSGATAVVLTLPDSISWLLNIRGADIAHNPVVQAFAVLSTAGKLALFAEPSKFDALGPDPRISILPRSAFPAYLRDMEGPVLIDPNTAPHAVLTMLRDGGDVEIIEGDDP
ncbi:aminopeptidase P family N-terminal domain-containing protein, partial [Celeribacter marinus]|uniref:aminopeptidase P family N-terminal domain-containing protein n=1 Tax=Celeribacter marinus TaxID=1397108 RepID=UPI003F6A9FD6